MRRNRFWVTTALGAWAVAACGASFAEAAEVALPDLVLKKTYLKTVSPPDVMALATTSWRNVFSPTSIVCPGTSGTCTARIELGATFSSSSHDAYSVRCRIIRSSLVLPYAPALPGEAPMYLVGADVVENGSRTFSWVFRSLALGSHTLTAQCRSQSASPVLASVAGRTLTIDVYKP